MTVQELIDKLRMFPPDFQVFCAHGHDMLRIADPSEVVMNLYHPQKRELIGPGDKDDHYRDCVVIYPSEHRDRGNPRTRNP